jgi:hypothetical protein
MKSLLRASFALLVLFGLCSPSAATEKVMSLCQFHYPSDKLVESDCVRLTSKDSPYKVFGKQWQDGLRFNRMDRRHFVSGLSVKVPKRIKDIRGFSPMPKNYPDADRDAKFILIDQNEMFLGAYEYGKLVFSTPVAVGIEGNRLLNGSYRVDAVDRRHQSSLYPVEGTNRPYPMHFGLRIYTDKRPDGWTSYWLHGRDIPGYPASHGCIGLYDEEMQKSYYHEPGHPILKDARKLFFWVVGGSRDSGKFRRLRQGPRVLIMGTPPLADAVAVTAPAAPPSVTPAAVKPLQGP